VKDQVRAYLESSKPGYQVTVRELDVVPGPTIAIYPPVKPSVYDFTAKLEVVQLDDRLQQYVVTGSYNLNTRRVTVTGQLPTVF
jgi:TolB-like protein